MSDLAKKSRHPEGSTDYSDKIRKTPGLRALYDNIGDEDIALALHEEIIAEKPDAWRGSKIKQRKVKNIIKKHIEYEEDVEKIFDIITNQQEY